MIELTTARPEMDCPVCGARMEIKTKGILGGILAQMFTHRVFDAFDRKGGHVTNGRCGHEYYLSPKRNRKSVS